MPKMAKSWCAAGSRKEEHERSSWCTLSPKREVERIIYTDVARDGMLTGVNIEQTLVLARESGLKVTASGGVSSLEDLERLKQLTAFGVDSVIVGKALYEGRFTLKQASQALL